jgi:hypothetical protein
LFLSAHALQKLTTGVISMQKNKVWAVLVCFSITVAACSEKASHRDGKRQTTDVTSLSPTLNGKNPIPSGLASPSPWLSSDLDSLPKSHYISEQNIQNPKTAGERLGFDPSYSMLNFRKLEGVVPNPGPGVNGHIVGLRTHAQSVHIPTDGDVIGSKALVDHFLQALDSSSVNFPEILAKIQSKRKSIVDRLGNRPRVLISGLGPSGLLAALEAYSDGSSIIGVEQRSQYTRPQVLRLTTDTMNRIRYFIGDNFWSELHSKGVFSRSPNWLQNKFDLNNPYLYPEVQRIQSQIDLTSVDLYKRLLKALKDEKQKEIRDSFTDLERSLYTTYVSQNLELDIVEIVRINHLETLLAAVVEKLAKSDPTHLRIYYGGRLRMNAASQMEMMLHANGQDSVLSVAGDIVTMTEGSGTRLPETLGFRYNTLSKPLFGATVAFRLPVGFDISLRPIENREGTASVIGIAKIDPEKLTGVSPPASGVLEGHTWSMIDETTLCHQLNGVIHETVLATQTADEGDLMFPCVPPEQLSPFWLKRNGGEHSFLPRTRYFFTGGIAYMGADLTPTQYALFQKRADSDHLIGAAAKSGLRKFMLTLAKKHMPKEYVEGQAPGQLVAPEAEGSNTVSADHQRVVTVTEEAYSLGLFPVEIRKRDRLFVVSSLENRPVRFLALGDCYATTHFFTGSGAVNGLRASMFFGRALENGASPSDWADAEKEVSGATDEMHAKVIQGKGNSPLDGPFNESL